MKTVTRLISPKLIIPAGFVMLLALVFVSSISAHQAAKVKGVVFDPQDAVVVRARFRLESNIVKRAIESDDFGRFELEAPFGSYEITIESSGFKKLVLTEFQLKGDVVQDSSCASNLCPLFGTNTFQLMSILKESTLLFQRR